MNTDFLNDLNESQRKAVTHISGSSLVIAGAGSGKTRVLTYRIAYLLCHDVKPWEIMALTFTNKAAREMKERIAKLVGIDTAQHLRMGTFHSVLGRMLRYEAEYIGYNRNYTIYDEADSRSLINTIIKERGLDNKIYKAAEVHRRISEAKNNLMTAEMYRGDVSAISRDNEDKLPLVHSIYTEYSRRCMLSNAMDFDDLLLNAYLLFKNNPERLAFNANQYRFILVDEYQDTNHAQQVIINQLASVHNNVCAVGDDAQSIYGFRGANIDNILNFQSQYRDSTIFKLEQNYRSTQRIVKAANSLIHKNERQIHKDVYSMGDEGEKISLTCLSSDREEALFICKDIKQRINSEHLKYSDFAILYRTNYQSRTFEEQFMKSAIPYRIYGGMSFFSRKEIKDIAAYMRLIVNHHDDEAFERIINYPARGIGETTVRKLRAAALEAGLCLWDAVGNLSHETIKINKGTQTKLFSFCQLIASYTARLDTDDALTLGQDIIRGTGISTDIYSGNDPEQLSRQEHVEEFLSSMQEFVETQRESGEPTGLEDFLREISLLSDREEEDDNVPKVSLMTIHSAKGLEFPCVYIVGMEENLFPSQLSQGSMRELEEERRLLYVAITRAEQHCHLTYAKMRFRYGKMEFCSPSRFLYDIDPRLITSNTNSGLESTLYSPRRSSAPPAPQRSYMPQRALKPFQSVAAPVHRQPMTTSVSTVAQHNNAALNIGDRITHNRFGAGIITAIQGAGDSQKVTVDFDNSGTKQLLTKFAKINKI